MDAIEDLLNDDLRGATSIFREALNLFLLSDKQEEIYTAVEKFKISFPTMGLFQNLSEQLKGLSVLKDIHQLLYQLSGKLKNNFDLIISAAGSQFSDNRRITTISHSSYVRELILRNSKNVEYVYCLRSGPRCEGEDLSKILRGNGIITKVIEDSSYRSALIKTNLVLVGSDLISDHFFINKKGTKSLVEKGHELGTEVFILGDSLRYVPSYVCKNLPPTFEMIPIVENYHVYM